MLYRIRSPCRIAFSRRLFSQTQKDGGETTHFGFKSIPRAEKESMVGQVFSSVADKYDVMNDVMSLGIHRLWKDHFVRKLNPMPGIKVLDVAGGTGDIAFRLEEHMRLNANHMNSFVDDGKITVLDINPDMLNVGRKKAADRGYEMDFVLGNAEKLEEIPDGSMDLYTIAFGIRNCTHVDRVLTEAFRVLRRGGRFACLEFSHVEYPILKEYLITTNIKLI